MSLVEMLDGESTFVKTTAIKDMIKSGMKIGTLAHDCACVIKKRFEGICCERCRLDGVHSYKHTCGLAAVVHNKRYNSQAAEQLWSRMDKLSFVTEMTRAHYRCFLHNYCKWRNVFVRDARVTADVTPLLSRRRLKEHGR